MYDYYKKAKEKAVSFPWPIQQMSDIRHLMTQSKEKGNK